MTSIGHSPECYCETCRPPVAPYTNDQPCFDGPPLPPNFFTHNAEADEYTYLAKIDFPVAPE
jgi:hypothetical protein